MARMNHRFSVDESGRLHEASVSESIARLAEMFPQVDCFAMEAQLMLERAHRLLANDRQAHWNRYGLTGSRYVLLRMLYSSPAKRLTMGEIATNMNLGANGATQLVDAMVRTGLVERENASGDKRVIFAVLTQKGLELFAKVMPETAERVKRDLGTLSREEQQTLSHLLAKIRMHMLASDELLEIDHPSDRFDEGA